MFEEKFKPNDPKQKIEDSSEKEQSNPEELLAKGNELQNIIKEKKEELKKLRKELWKSTKEKFGYFAVVLGDHDFGGFDKDKNGYLEALENGAELVINGSDDRYKLSLHLFDDIKKTHENLQFVDACKESSTEYIEGLNGEKLLRPSHEKEIAEKIKSLLLDEKIKGIIKFTGYAWGDFIEEMTKLSKELAERGCIVEFEAEGELRKHSVYTPLGDFEVNEKE